MLSLQCVGSQKGMSLIRLLILEYQIFVPLNWNSYKDSPAASLFYPVKTFVRFLKVIENQVNTGFIISSMSSTLHLTVLQDFLA